VPLGVIQLAFDPVLQLGDTASVRYETIGLAVVLFLALLSAAWIGSRTPSVGPYVPAPGLRVDDLVFAVVGAVPGAIVGGRLGTVLDHFEFYRANPAAILDPNQGGLTLTLAVPFGLFTGAVIARLLGAPVARWLHATALPLLFLLAAGKLVGVLGATGQGSPSDLAWATAYTGPGPWGSLAPELPSHPAQVYEAVLVTIAIGFLLLASRLEVVARRDGAAMFIALGLWAIARVVVGFTWRDPAILGPFGTEQLLAFVVLAIAIVGLVERWRAPFASAVERRPDAEARPA
jgi:prolipoprotein diacylglyceryltransferase